MSTDEKIAIFLQSQKSVKHATFSKTKITTQKNKEGSHLLYVKTSIFEKSMEQFILTLVNIMLLI